MASFTPYQIDYSVKNASKTFGFSKKRVVFKFGIANESAIAEGLQGANCRGSEHEVIFIWSLNTGKRQILADGKDVHFSESGQNGWTTDNVFQHHFSIRIPGINTSLRCHLITQPANRDVPSIKPFDLKVQGMSYFSFCKIYELGTARMTSRALKASLSPGSYSGGGGSRRTNDPDDDPYITPEERKAIAAAKLASMKEFERQQQKQQSSSMASGGSGSSPGGNAPSGGMARDEGNLINLLDDPAPVPTQSQPSGFMVSSMTMDPSLSSAHGGSFGHQPPPSQQGYGNYSLGGPPPPPQQQQPPPGHQPYGQPPQNPYGQPPPTASFGAPPPPPNAFGGPPATPSNSITSYGQPPPPDPFFSSFSQPPPQQQQHNTPPPMQQQQAQAYYQAPPPAQPMPGFGSPPPNMPPQQQQTPHNFNNVRSPSNDTYMTYGSAPSFAQPPSHGQQHQQQPPPQQHQQQQQQFQGFPQY